MSDKGKDKKAVVKTAAFLKVKALENLSGKYKLPFSEGDEFLIDEKQGKELIELGSVELLKK